VCYIVYNIGNKLMIFFFAPINILVDKTSEKPDDPDNLAASKT